MQRRTLLGVGLAASAVAAMLSGCMARVSDAAKNPDKGNPWRCERCGYLTRSAEDLSGQRCPRCMAKRFRSLTEEEFAKWLNA